MRLHYSRRVEFLQLSLKQNSYEKCVYTQSSQNTCLSFTAKRQDEDYDEQVEESLQDEVKELL